MRYHRPICWHAASFRVIEEVIVKESFHRKGQLLYEAKPPSPGPPTARHQVRLGLKKLVSRQKKHRPRAYHVLLCGLVLTCCTTAALTCQPFTCRRVCQASRFRLEPSRLLQGAGAHPPVGDPEHQQADRPSGLEIFPGKHYQLLVMFPPLRVLAIYRNCTHTTPKVAETDTLDIPGSIRHFTFCLTRHSLPHHTCPTGQNSSLQAHDGRFVASIPGWSKYR